MLAFAMVDLLNIFGYGRYRKAYSPIHFSFKNPFCKKSWPNLRGLYKAHIYRKSSENFGAKNTRKWFILKKAKIRDHLCIASFGMIGLVIQFVICYRYAVNSINKLTLWLRKNLTVLKH